MAREFSNRLALAGPGVVDHGDVAALDRPLDLVEAHPLLAQQVERPLDIRIGHAAQLALNRQALVVGQFELGGGLDGGRELQRLAAVELNLLDVRLAQHIEFLLLDRLAVGLGDELALGLVLDLLLVFPQHHLARRFARPKAGQAGLAAEVLHDCFEGFIHLLRFNFHPHELLTRGQTLYCYIHKQAFPLIADKVQWARGLCVSAAQRAGNVRRAGRARQACLRVTSDARGGDTAPHLQPGRATLPAVGGCVFLNPLATEKTVVFRHPRLSLRA